METSGTSGVAENARSMVEIKIKTLDSETYTLRVDKCVPVPQLKEQIAIVTGVVSEQQRLICRGKVLKDDELLSAYHVEDGHTLHMVIRQPHQTSTVTGQTGPESATRNPDNSSTGTSGNRGARTIVFETVNIGQGDVPSQHIAQIISSILNAVATPGTASNVARTDQRDGGLSASNDTPSSEPVSQQVPLQPTGPMGPQQPNVIPDSLTTINQYLSFTRNEFSNEFSAGGFGATGPEHRNGGSASVRPSVLQSHYTESLQSTQSGLPNPSSLAAILLSTRELLTQQAGGYISQFAGRLEDHVTVTDPAARAELQNNVQRIGRLLQYLGSLLLELGRTTMTLSLGQTPSEAVINAGPALYISGSGPNQIMVQPVPFYPGSSFGISRTGSLSGHGSQSDAFGSAFIPANIGIRLRTGRTPPGSIVNQDEQIDSQQPLEQTDATRNISGANNAFQAFPDGSSFAGTAGVRVVPIRTVVAVPAGVARAPSEPAGTPVGLIYPVISRVQVSNGSRNDASINLASNETNPDVHYTIQQSDISPQARQAFETNSQNVTYNSPPVSVEYLSSDAPARHQGVSMDFNSTSSQHGEPNGNQTSTLAERLASSVGQFLRSAFPGAEVQVEGPPGLRVFGGGSDANQGGGQDANMQSERTEAGNEAVFFSNMVRQLMPFISQATSTVQDVSPVNLSSSSRVEQQNSSDASSSRHLRDPPKAPSPKRQKREDC